MSRLYVLLTISLFLALPVFFAQQPSASHFDGNSWWTHVKFLADDSLEGRDTGSEGLLKAETYAVEQLKKAGLEPAGTNGYFQPSVSTNSKSMKQNLPLPWSLQRSIQTHLLRRRRLSSPRASPALPPT